MQNLLIKGVFTRCRVKVLNRAIDFIYDKRFHIDFKLDYSLAIFTNDYLAKSVTVRFVRDGYHHRKTYVPNYPVTSFEFDLLFKAKEIVQRQDEEYIEYMDVININ